MRGLSAGGWVKEKEVRDGCLVLFSLDLWGPKPQSWGPGLVLRSDAFQTKDRGSAFLKAVGAWTKAGRFPVEVSTSGMRSPALLPGHHNHWVIHRRAACCSDSQTSEHPRKLFLRECVLMKGISNRADYNPENLGILERLKERECEVPTSCSES